MHWFALTKNSIESFCGDIVSTLFQTINCNSSQNKTSPSEINYNLDQLQFSENCVFLTI